MRRRVPVSAAGAPSIYYGDEAGIGGHIRTNEGCRWPMPWSRPIPQDPHYLIYSALCRAKRTHPALREGGLQFFPAQGKVLIMARSLETDWAVGILSMEEEERTLRLPMGALGENRLPERDLFGRPVEAVSRDDGSFLIRIPPCSCLLLASEDLLPG